MTTQDVYITSVITAHTCGECGVLFGLESYFLAERRRDGQRFYCPNGHPRVYRETDADRARKEAELAKARAERLARQLANRDEDVRSINASLIATKGHLTRAKRRAIAGVCPCCNRTFQDVVRHIAAKHPEQVTP